MYNVCTCQINVLFCSVLFGKTVSYLQNSLNLLYEYCLKWGLEVNTTKTKIMVFRKRRNIKEDEKWVYNNNELEVVSDFNYLGTVFNYTGSFVLMNSFNKTEAAVFSCRLCFLRAFPFISLNQETLAGKGLKALNVLLNSTKQYNFKPSVLYQLFDAFVSATLNYGSEIWDLANQKKLNVYI